jgi:chitinase
MILMAGKKKLIAVAQDLFVQLKDEGLEPDTRTYTEMIGALLQVDMLEEAMNLYRTMKESGCNPDKLTLTILIRNLEKLGRSDLAFGVRIDCEEFLDFPEKFLEEVNKTYVSMLAILNLSTQKYI